MTDELSGGGPPGARPWRAWVALGAVGAVLFGYVLTHRQSAGPDPAPPSPSVSLAAPTPRPSPWLPGPIRPGPAGLRLYVGGTRPYLLDAHTGARTPLSVPGLSGNRSAVLTRSGSSLFAFVRRPVSREDAEVYLVRPGRPAVGLGRADQAVAGRHGGPITMRLDVGVGRRSTVTGYDAAGRKRWQWTRSDVDIRLVADTAYGLLVHELDDPTADLGRLLLRDPVTGRLRRELAPSIPSPLAADAERVAWLGTGDCGRTCPVRVGKLADGTVRSLVNRPGRQPDYGAFSPDGRLLALPFRAEPSPQASVDVFGLAGRAVAPLPGLARSTGSFAGVEWTDSTTVALFAFDPPTRRTRVAIVPAVAPASGVPTGGAILPWTVPSTTTVGLAP